MITQMNKDIFLLHLEETVKEIKQRKGIFQGKDVFTIKPVVEKGSFPVDLLLPICPDLDKCKVLTEQRR